jgi:hypothetical protein
MAWSWEEDDYDIDTLPLQDLNRRASGEVPCEMCHQPLYRHYQPCRVTCGSLVMDCYQRFWKL